MISVILIDSELTNLKKLKNSLIRYEDINICGMYTNLIDAVKDIEIKRPDAIFLDIEDSYMGWIEKEFNDQNINPEIIFFAEHEEFAFRAFEAGALDYLLKPITSERLKKSIIRLRKRLNIKDKNEVKKTTLQVQCFGKYTLTKNEINTESIKWRTNKVKELFAYLILKNGKDVHKSELIEILFEGVDQKKAQNNLYVTMSYLRKQLEEFGIDRNSILVKGNYSLQIGRGVCDFVDFNMFLNKYSSNKIDAQNIREYEKIIKLYKGEYLEDEDYLWAYDVREYIYKKYEEILLSMVEYYKNNNNLRKAEKMLLNIIEENFLSEDGNKGLLELYIELEKKKLYIKQYERYATLLSEEFNIMPEKKYSNYYNMIYNDN